MFTSDQIWKAVDELALEHGLSASRLSILAGLDPTALNKSKRIGCDGRPRWMSTETVAKILTVTGTSLVEFVHMVDGVHAEAAAHADLQSTGRRWLGARASILLVDPDETFSAHAATALGAAGYNIHVMPDFRRALELVESGRPIDLIMVQLALPHGAHGLALARIAVLRRPDLKVVFLADDGGSQRDDETLGTILRKPLEDSRLLSETARILQS
jgi:CheY-like chemotaxis protein